MSTKVVTAHLPREIAAKLDELAERLERPRGWIVKQAVEAYVNLAEERRRETRLALKEADSGRTIEHAEVERWSNGLRPATRRKARATGGA
jgi:predicted transcriptional regulator